MVESDVTSKDVYAIVLYKDIDTEVRHATPLDNLRAGLWYEFFYRKNIPLCYRRKELLSGNVLLQGYVHDGRVSDGEIATEKRRIEQGVTIWERTGSVFRSSGTLYDELVVREWQPRDWEGIS